MTLQKGCITSSRMIYSSKLTEVIREVASMWREAWFKLVLLVCTHGWDGMVRLLVFARFENAAWLF